MDKDGKLRIRSASDLFNGLDAGDLGIQFSVLRAISKNPQAAYNYGKVGDQDLIDKLVAKAETLVSSNLRAAVLGALYAFKDRRIFNLFKKNLHLETDHAQIKLCANYLALWPDEETFNIFSTLLMQEKSPTHARVAANAMSGLNDLNPSQVLRVALLADIERAPQPAPPDSETWKIWKDALAGDCRDRARRILEGFDEETFLLLRDRMDELSVENRKWLLVWGTGHFPVYVIEPLADILKKGGEELLLTAVECVNRLGYPALFSSMLKRYAEHPDEAVRAETLRSGLVSIDWQHALSTEPSIPVKIEIMKGLTRETGNEAASTLLNLLDDADYRIRAVAAQCLASLGCDITELVKSHHPDNDLNFKAAVRQAFIQTEGVNVHDKSPR